MTCDYGNAFNYKVMTETFACGIQIGYGKQTTTAGYNETLPFLPPFPGPGIEKCCAIRNKKVQRISGNSACDIQWCEVPEFNGTYTTTISPDDYWYTQYATSTASVGAPIVMVGESLEELPEMKQCIFGLTLHDLGLSDEQISDGEWSLISFCSLQTSDPCDDEGFGFACGSSSLPGSTITSMPSGPSLRTTSDGNSISRTAAAANSSSSSSPSANAARCSKHNGLSTGKLTKWMTAGLFVAIAGFWWR